MIMYILNLFLEIPLWGRAAIVLLILFGVWGIFGRLVFWILSIIPFLAEKIFLLLYYIVEMLVSVLHKTFGAFFSKIDNSMAACGEKIDNALKAWYNAWHSKYKFKWKFAIISYFVCLSFIVLPTYITTESEMLKAGEAIYLSGESYIVGFFKKYEQDDEQQKEAENNQKEQSDTEIEDELLETVDNDAEIRKTEIELIVSGLNSSLLVRDVPDLENGVALERLYNGDVVIWTGEMVFAEAKDNHVEIWAKVITQNGVEGWSRLYYLHPKQYEGIKFHVGQR